MKKLLALCLATLFIITSIVGCEKKQKQMNFISMINSDFAYPAPLNLDWGMARDDSFKKMGLNESHFETYTASESEITTVLSADMYAGDITIDGQDATVVLYFANENNKSLCGFDLGLVAADIYYLEPSKERVDTEFPATVLEGASIYDAAEKAGAWVEMSEFMEKTWRSAYKNPETGEITAITNSEMNKIGLLPVAWELFAKDKLVKVDNIPAGELDVSGKKYYGMLMFKAPYAAYLNLIE